MGSNLPTWWLPLSRIEGLAIVVTEVDGDWKLFARALGAREQDDSVILLSVHVGTAFETDDFDGGGGPDSRHYTFGDAGVEFIFRDRVLSSVVFHLVPDPEDECLPFPEADVLFTGLPKAPVQEDLAALLGETEDHGEFDGSPWDRYAVGDVHLHVGLVERSDQVKTLMLQRDTS